MHWWPLNQHHRLLRSHALLCSGRQSPPRVYCSAPECKFPFHSPTPMAQTGPAGDHAGAGQAAGNPDTPPLRPSTPSSTRRAHPAIRLGDHGAGSRRLVLPGGREDTDGLVVARQTVDTRLDENEAELGVPVLAVALKVLADGDSLEERLAFQHLSNATQAQSASTVVRAWGFLTFLMSMYRSSGISGARPVTHLSVSQTTKQRH